MKKISALVLGLFLFPLIAQPVQAVTLSDFELSAVVQVWSYNDNEDYMYQGTGYFVDFTSGCFVTATHVITDDNDDYRENNIVILNPDTEDEEVYWTIPIIAYSDADIAFMCIDDEEYVPQFRHYFEFGLDTFGDLSVGDNLTGIGYPSSGGDSLTASFGELTGFSSYIGDKDIIKTNLDISAGISGGPVIADNKDVVGMLISQDEEVTYAVSADLLSYVDELASETVVKSLVDSGYASIPDDCVVDESTDYYTDSDYGYYDGYCSVKIDEAKENTLQNQYEYWCDELASDDYIDNAAYALDEEGGGLMSDDWRNYLDQLCGELDEEDYYNYYTPGQDMGATLVKSNEFEAVYAVLLDGKRHAFYNEAIYKSWFDEDFSGVKTVSSEELASYSLGYNVTFHPGTLIKIPSISKVYMVSDDTELRWVTDENTAKILYGEDWNTKIFDVSETLFTNYTIGDDVTL